MHSLQISSAGDGPDDVVTLRGKAAQEVTSAEGRLLIGQETPGSCYKARCEASRSDRNTETRTIQQIQRHSEGKTSAACEC